MTVGHIKVAHDPNDTSRCVHPTVGDTCDTLMALV